MRSVQSEIQMPDDETEEKNTLTHVAADSPGFAFIEFFYRNQGHQMGRSRERFNGGVRECGRVAIRYGLEFHIDDFERLARSQTQSYHDTSIWRADEWEYSLACGSERGRFNKSAALSYEKWRGRKPFLVADIGSTTPTRIFVGRDFVWAGARVKCTSFNDKEGTLVACSYKPRAEGEYESKIDRRFTITHKDLKEAKDASSPESK
jgi:hypothetical protein